MTVERKCSRLSSVSVPSTFKDAYITPLLKKASMNPADERSYRLISNLSVMSKLLKRLVTKQLVEGVLVVIQAASGSTVGVSCTPLNGDTFGYLEGYQCWKFGSTCSPRSSGGVRYCRSRDVASAFKDIVRSRWNSSEMDIIVHSSF